MKAWAIKDPQRNLILGMMYGSKKKCQSIIDDEGMKLDLKQCGKWMPYSWAEEGYRCVKVEIKEVK